MCVHTYSLSPVGLFVTFGTVARRAPRSMGFFGQEYWSRLPFSSSRGSSPPRDLLCLLHSRPILYCLSQWESLRWRILDAKYLLIKREVCSFEFFYTLY